MKIRRLLQFNTDQFKQLQALMHVLSPRCVLTEEILTVALQSSLVYVAEEGNRIIGMATLCIGCTPTGRKASIEDVVVCPECQGKGIGEALVRRLIEEVGKNAPIQVQLTSKPARVAANALYVKLGFVRKETNVYAMQLED